MMSKYHWLDDRKTIFGVASWLWEDPVAEGRRGERRTAGRVPKYRRLSTGFRVAR
jgi:hypothetical protein